ncbi:hypothetical protein LMG27198_06960 [Methylocystis echinoides]|uniref:Uncharacterized protein n=1 Tax=Methylocystis echinoides TaxID=29468 RepID=A0A9W6LQX8_9HYPH|nr:hypothetical protein LMG27198_06960 [Methylocystis echinoides]
MAPTLSLPRFAGEGTLAISILDEGTNLLPLPRRRGRGGEGVYASAFSALLPA